MNYNKISSPSRIKNIKLEDLFIVDINRIKKEHEMNEYNYNNKNKNIIKAQVLYHFLFNILEQSDIYNITADNLHKILIEYFNYHKIKYYGVILSDLCHLFIKKYTDSDTISIEQLKYIYKKIILTNKYKITNILSIEESIEFYGLLEHNYIFEEKFNIYNYIKKQYNTLKIYIINNRIYIIWILIYSIINLSLFLWKFYKYRNDEQAFKLYGYGPAFSKGFAQICLLNTFLILLPLSYGLLRFLRQFETLRYYIPFDINIKFHKICGYVILLAGLAHGIAHINTFFNKIQKLDIDIWLNTKLYKTGALRDGRTFNNYVSSLPGWTGIALSIVFIIATPLTCNFIKKRNFDLFWYSHYLFFPLYFVLIVFHGANQWFEKTTAWMWAIGPFILYSLERIYRYFNKIKPSVFKIIESDINDNIIILKLEKTKEFKNYIPSMYLFLNIPLISKLEWHPFTIVSDPQVNYIKLYIENVGDWTKCLYNLVKNKCDIPNIYIDGPINSPSENFDKYDICMMVCGGIGITPFLSIIKNIVLQTYNYKKVNIFNEQLEKLSKRKIYLYWCNRNQNLFNICSKILNDIIKLDCMNQVEIHTYLTKIKNNMHLDILSNIQYICHKLTNIDIISNVKGKNNMVNLGRPDFDDIFKTILQKYQNKTIAVLFCGSVNFKQEIKKKCKLYSKNEVNVKFKLYYEYF